jgi:dihydroorotate dehydrogenase (NAD+) catalytic subunit
VRVYAVGLGDTLGYFRQASTYDLAGTGMDTLRTLARASGGRFLFTSSAERLAELYTAIRQEISEDTFYRLSADVSRGKGTLRVAVIVSLLGESPEDVAGMVSQLDREEGVAAIELNLSCPNVRQGHAQRSRYVSMIAQDPEATLAVVQAARGQTTKPLLAKLSPDVTDLVPVAQAAESGGADGICLVNTFVGMRIDPHTRRSRLSMPTGGLSGPAIRPLAVYRVWYTVQSLRIPVIGMGGIARAEDAIEFLIAGARAIAVGTATFADPQAALRVLHGIERYLARHGLSSVRELSGSWRGG